MDNFDVYKWKQNSKQSSKNNSEFDVYEWNKNRYLNEGFNDREVKGRLSDIKYDFLTSYFNGETFHTPNSDDSSRQINGEGDWVDWKQDTLDRYGNVDLRLDNTVVWYDQIKVLDNKFQSDKEGYTKGKAAFLDKERKMGRTSGLDEVKNTIKFIKENNPEFTTEEIAAELKEIKELGSQLNEKLCKKGEAYRKRRMAAGEKSSAYLSGRAVKVCKGQMSGKKKKK
jgi:hypothetical protein